jgi:hypothetical protein
LLTGTKPGQSIYGHIRRSCTGFLTIGGSNADRLRAGLDR